jgi:hypothetical protein
MSLKVVFNALTGRFDMVQNLTAYVPTSRTLTINGTTYDLSANRTWTIAAGGTIGGTIANTQVGVGSATDTLSGSANLVSTSAIRLLAIGSDATASNWAFQSRNSAGTPLAYVRNDVVFLFGTSTVLNASEVANFYKNQNNPTGLRVINNTSGVNALAYVNATANNGSTGISIAHYSAGYNTGTWDASNTGVLIATTVNGMNIATSGNAPIKTWTNSLERQRITGGGLFYVGGGADANSTLQVGGSLAVAYVAKTANYTATVSDCIIDCTANSFTVTLPTAVGITGRIYVITNSGTGTITVGTTSSQTISGGTNPTLSQWETLEVYSTGSNWNIK